MRRRKHFSETGLVKALDPGQGLGFFQRFQYRLLGYLLVLSIASSVVAGGIYYSRQVKFVEAEQSKRGSTLISNLAGQSELGAYSGDSTFLFGPARRAFQESDVSFTAIYDVKGRALIKMSKPGLSPDLALPTALLQRLLRDPTSAPIRRSRADYDDLFAPVVSVREDPEAGLFGAQAKTRGAMTIGVARLGLSRMPAQQKLDEVLRWGIYLALIVLAMGAAAALLLSRRLSQPIMALARGADEMRRGNLGYQLKLKRTDELGLIAETFNRMSSKLRQTVESLAHLNRNLEQEVARPYGGAAAQPRLRRAAQRPAAAGQAARPRPQRAGGALGAGGRRDLPRPAEPAASIWSSPRGRWPAPSAAPTAKTRPSSTRPPAGAARWRSAPSPRATP